MILLFIAFGCTTIFSLKIRMYKSPFLLCSALLYSDRVKSRIRKKGKRGIFAKHEIFTAVCVFQIYIV